METLDSSTKTLRCIVVTPERSVLDETAAFIALPMYDGELGVLPGRAPLIGKLGFGELRVVKGKLTHRYYVDGGFVQVRNNVVTVLTPKAITAEDIKPDVVTENLKAAQKVTTGAHEQEEQLKTQARARAQLRVARKVHGDGDGHH